MADKLHSILSSGVSKVLRRGWPLLLLVGFLIWGWRNQSLGSSIPQYGDTMEMMWVLSWYGDAIRAGQSISTYPLAFFPSGWRYSENLYMLLGMLPLHWLGGPAFAYNLVLLLTFVAAFIGAYLLARLFIDRFAATIAALLIAFWGGRWFHTYGHVNVLIGSALVPWVLWTLTRGLRAERRRLVWLVLTGVLWALSMAGSLYFALLVGVAVATWIAGSLMAKTITWRTALVGLAVPATVAVALSMPAIYWLWSQGAESGATFYTIGEVNFWGASLNNLPIPSIDHPWLGPLARRIYQGIPYEQASTNLGMLASILAIVGLVGAFKRRAWLPVIFLAGVTLTLTLGLTLKWDNETVRLELLRPVNAILWKLGYWLKPGFFASAQPPAPFDTGVLLPGTLVSAVIPMIELARVFARYALVAAVAVFLLTGLGLSMVRYRWARLTLAVVLIVEVLPAPMARLPFPPPVHPAFEWLRQQPMAGESIADLIAAHPSTPDLFNEGETVFATLYHGKPTVAGASSIWPADTLFLYDWLASHQHSFWNLDMVPILRFYGVRYILLHMRSEMEPTILEEAKSNQELRFVNCFPAVPGPWNYPICVLEVLPPHNPKINLVLQDGWSGQEDWGVWAEGTESAAFWVATAKQDQRLQIEAFPQCVEDRQQSIKVDVNGVAIGNYTWPSCDPWLGEIKVPADVVRLGRNDLTVHSAYTARPVDASNGQSDDTRKLSVGFTMLRIEPEPAP